MILVPAHPKYQRHPFGLSISRYDEDYVKVPRRSGFGSESNREASDEGVAEPAGPEVGIQPDQGFLEASHLADREGGPSRLSGIGTLLKPSVKAMTDLLFACLRIPTPEVLPHHLLGRFAQIERGKGASENLGIANGLHGPYFNTRLAPLQHQWRSSSAAAHRLLRLRLEASV